MSTKKQSWKRKQRLSDAAARMRAAKRAKNAPAVCDDDRPQSAGFVSVDADTGAASGSTEGPMDPVDAANTSISPPDVEQPHIHTSVHTPSTEETGPFESDAELEDEVGELDSQTVFDDWMLTLTKPQRKMLAVLLYCSFQKRQKMSKTDAAQESASITGEFLTCTGIIILYAMHCI